MVQWAIPLYPAGAGRKALRAVGTPPDVPGVGPYQRPRLYISMLVPTHANAGGEGRVSRLQVAARMLADFIGGRIGTGSRYQPRKMSEYRTTSSAYAQKNLQRREIGVAADNLRDDKINRTHANVDEQTDVVQRHSHQGQFFVLAFISKLDTHDRNRSQLTFLHNARTLARVVASAMWMIIVCFPPAAPTYEVLIKVDAMTCVKERRLLMERCDEEDEKWLAPHGDRK